MLQQVLHWLREHRLRLLLSWEERQQVLQQWREVRAELKQVRWLGMLRGRLEGRQMHRRMQELLHRATLDRGVKESMVAIVQVSIVMQARNVAGTDDDASNVCLGMLGMWDRPLLMLEEVPMRLPRRPVGRQMLVVPAMQSRRRLQEWLLVQWWQ